MCGGGAQLPRRWFDEKVLVILIILVRKRQPERSKDKAETTEIVDFSGIIRPQVLMSGAP